MKRFSINDCNDVIKIDENNIFFPTVIYINTTTKKPSSFLTLSKEKKDKITGILRWDADDYSSYASYKYNVKNYEIPLKYIKKYPYAWFVNIEKLPSYLIKAAKQL